LLQQRKSREGDRVCRKNKEGIRESRDSIKKGTRRNEVASKQRKNRSRRIEEE